GIARRHSHHRGLDTAAMSQASPASVRESRPADSSEQIVRDDADLIESTDSAASDASFRTCRSRRGTESSAYSAVLALAVWACPHASKAAAGTRTRRTSTRVVDPHYAARPHLPS